jgi:nucleoside-diphosphate-sugar epimerase
MKSPSVSITGATGFIGWHLSGAFRAAGWRVVAIARPGRQHALPDGVTRAAATLDATALAPVFEATDLVIHAAGLARGWSAGALHAVNGDGTQAVVEAANATGARLVFVSSQAAAGTGTRARPAREDDEPRPVTPYGHSKLAGERVLRSSARVPWTIVRPASVFGPRDRQFLPLFALGSRGMFPVVASPGAAFSVIHVDDVARAILLLAEAPPASVSGTTLFLAHPQAPDAETLLRAVAGAVDRPFRPQHVPAPILRIAAAFGDLAWRLGRTPVLDSVRLGELRSEGFVCAVDRAREVIGFSAAIELEAGFERTARWYREAGWLTRAPARR